MASCAPAAVLGQLVFGKLKHAQMFQGKLVAKVERSTVVTRISKC